MAGAYVPTGAETWAVRERPRPGDPRRREARTEFRRLKCSVQEQMGAHPRTVRARMHPVRGCAFLAASEASGEECARYKQNASGPR